MNFNDIDNLNKEETEQMYLDILDTIDNEYIAHCCCTSGAYIFRWGQYSSSCRTWCWNRGSECSGWSNRDYGECSSPCS